jgi:hypothetical protein
MSLYKLALAIKKSNKIAYYGDGAPYIGDSYNSMINAEYARKKALYDAFKLNRAQKIKAEQEFLNSARDASRDYSVTPSAALAQDEFSRYLASPNSWTGELAIDIQNRARGLGSVPAPVPAPVPGPIYPAASPGLAGPATIVQNPTPLLATTAITPAQPITQIPEPQITPAQPVTQIPEPQITTGLPEVASAPGFMDNMGATVSGLASKYLTPTNVGYGAGALALAGGAYGIHKLLQRNKRKAREAEMARLARIESMRQQTRDLQPFYRPYMDSIRGYF